jgi:hypothetical protein
MHGGDRVPTPPLLPPVNPYYRRPFNLKPVLPPIGSSLYNDSSSYIPPAPSYAPPPYIPPAPSYAPPSVPSWKERRNTFVEMQDRRSRGMSGQFHYPSRKSTYTPWERIKYSFVKDKRQWPPTFE